MKCSKCKREMAPAGSHTLNFHKQRQFCWASGWPQNVPAEVSNIVETAQADCRAAAASREASRPQSEAAAWRRVRKAMRGMLEDGERGVLMWSDARVLIGQLRDLAQEHEDDWVEQVKRRTVDV